MLDEEPLREPVFGLSAPSTLATNPPPAVMPEERDLLRTAAKRVELLYPNAVGRHLKTDLESWASYGCFRMDGKGILAAAVAEILAAPLPENLTPTP